jgi:hypothetical protein
MVLYKGLGIVNARSLVSGADFWGTIDASERLDAVGAEINTSKWVKAETTVIQEREVPTPAKRVPFLPDAMGYET